MTLKRTGFKRPSTQKPVKCKVCRTEFVRQRPGQKVCSSDCASSLAVSDRLKKERAEQKRLERAERQQIAARKEQLKPIPKLIAEAQVVFNRYIRARDEGQPCICCGKFPQSSALTGGSWDAGHYRSRGSAGHLRFHEDNCHAQLKRCNNQGAGNAVGYRIGLINRIGLERVEALEANNAIHKWTATELRKIKATYQKKLKELKNRRA